MVDNTVLAVVAIAAAVVAIRRRTESDPVARELSSPTDRDSDGVVDGVESDQSGGGTDTAVNRPTWERLSGGIV